MGAVFCNGSPVKHIDAVIVPDCVQLVRDGEDVFSLKDGVGKADDFLFRLRVQSGGWLIHQHDFTFSQKRPRDGKTLLLPAGKIGSTFLQKGFITVGKSAYIIVKPHRAHGGPYFLHGSVRISVTEIFRDGVGKQERFLRNDGKAFPRLLQIER